MLSIPNCARRGALAAIFIASAMDSNAQQPAASGTLEEIVVTAQKREQNSQDIGISLSAISGADLNSLGAVTATDITKSMPAVVLTQPNGPSSFSLAIRGVTQNDFADYQESPAAIYVDDVYVSQIAGLEQSGFGIANLRVNYTPQSGKLEVGASVENVADKHYGVMGFDNTSINGLAQIYPGMPRWFKFHVNYKF
jgi:outer membrane receptor protein involved in Fe transport